MPMLLKGSCRCGAVRFEVAEPHARALSALLLLDLPQAAGRRRLRHQSGRHFGHAEGRRARRISGCTGPTIHDDERPEPEVSTGERRFCRECGAAMWLYDPTWPELVHPFASAVDTDLPKAPQRVHLMLKYKASWVEPDIRPGDTAFDLYPPDSIADWHKRHGLWVD